ncbi:MAG: hypothetical protein UU73_C0003G0309 [Candidatus Daviesbacteria bacterium GW2011_GWA1_41_61]|uniref:Cyanophycin synthase-like N-terminal domain-containing protein n=1 Tax=Candidatus Daviesbacteria bacterium GW2011_GWA2_40_9 TaxID=1618424 RepID=A0A0G0U0V2_9BACT|nr:MAG: hypothetical protein UU26_C0035G0002 [Candidatus Daviesbacteria bacterium GW2011_GWC1_40_9]KKR82703.1 MAG: hypothetical protein UU29_C0010G0049 [Candidatus Daviesbacteria bacterium GW2011_GWA2_40_9]KKR93341.1 MAG: hypothetical protein UU44_C0002G0002 [Candidatus Daviesbacteria bacterium GW2011_GWB1_41_15]KKS15110.1 MAG: hypothetical protein UU73_C0003G0309 [Candidatus Daviesbacteria bacterium GW2011_GWA1_41_61]
MPETYLAPFFSDNFQLKVKLQQHQTRIYFRVLNCHCTTSSLPQTCSILEHFLPGLCHHQCFNNKQIPFLKEAQNTEVGHLFEHILLEYLYLLKNNSHQHHPIHKGETVWDWKEEEKGIFHITIDIGSSEMDTLTQALDQGIRLLGLIVRPQKQGNVSV